MHGKKNYGRFQSIQYFNQSVKIIANIKAETVKRVSWYMKIKMLKNVNLFKKKWKKIKITIN